MRPFTAFSLACGLLLICRAPLGAAIFMRLHGSDSRQLQALGGQTLYATTARVNGSQTQLHVFGFDSSVRDVGDELRRLWSLPPLAAQGPAWITRMHEGRLRHLMILPGLRFSESTVWLIEPQDKDAVPQGAAIPQPPGTNPYPAGELRFWVANDRTHSVLTLFETPSDPSAVLAEVAAMLGKEGWQEMTRTAGLSLFARAGRSAVAFASRRAAAGPTQLAVFLQGAATSP
jgi:hypothetical protein